MRQRRALSAKEEAEVRRLSSLVSNHAGRMSRFGKVTTCGCDLYRHAVRKLEELHARVR